MNNSKWLPRALGICILVVSSAACQKRLHGTIKVAAERIENPDRSAYQDWLGTAIAVQITNKDTYDWNDVRIEAQCIRSLPDSRIFSDNRTSGRVPAGSTIQVQFNPFPACTPTGIYIKSNEGRAALTKAPSGGEWSNGGFSDAADLSAQ